MGYIARLRRDNTKLILSSGRYELRDFVPPATTEIPQFVQGTAANKLTGAPLTATRGANRDFVFTVRILGDKTSEVDQAIEDLNAFLAAAGNMDHPTFLDWKSDNNYSYEPYFGQFGAFRSVQIEFGRIERQGLYGVGNLRTRGTIIQVMLMIRPYAWGRELFLGHASGGIQEDIMGMIDGRSRGLQISPAIVNKMTNPVFGSSLSNWNTGWTASSVSLIATRNDDAEFILRGQFSAKLVNTHASSTLSWRQSINVGNTNTHTLSFYVKRPDGAAVTSNDCLVLYSTFTSKFVPVGNGWYRIVGIGPGVNAAQNTGVQVKAGRTIYVDCFQMEEYPVPTAFSFGDIFGNSWTGTAHNSTTNRSVGLLRWDSERLAFQNAFGTIRVVWQADYDSSDLPSGSYNLFAGGMAGFAGLYNRTASDWRFTDGTNTINSNTQTFAAGDRLIFHFVYQPGSLKIYLNGAQIATGSTYTLGALINNFYLGSNATPGQHIGGTFLGFAVFHIPMTAAEAALDAAEIAAMIADDRPVETIPWFWTRNNDGVMENGIDATPRRNFGIIGGVPGNVAAESTLYGYLPDGGVNVEGLAMSLHFEDYDRFEYPGYILFFDQSGTVGAGLIGGEEDITSVGVWPAQYTIGFSNLPDHLCRSLAGREFYIFARLKDATAGTLRIVAILTGFGNSVVTSDALLNLQTSYRLFHWGTLTPAPLNRKNMNATLVDNFLTTLSSVQIRGGHISGTSDVSCDWFALAPRPVTIADVFTLANYFIYRNGVLVSTSDATYSDIYSEIPIIGDPLEFLPGRLNILSIFLGDEDENPLISLTVQFLHIKIVPRWRLQ